MKRINHTIPSAALFGLVAGVVHADTFHGSPTGDDAHTGTSPATAWKTLERVSRQVLQPGDSLLFESGGTWQGQLRPQGSGTEGQLKPTSPCINAGVVITNHGGRDFWGHPIIAAKPDIGAHESTGLSKPK